MLIFSCKTWKKFCDSFMGKDLNASFFKPTSHQRHSPLVGAGLEMRLPIRCAVGNADEYPWLGIVQCLLLHGPCFQWAEFTLQQEACLSSPPLAFSYPTFWSRGSLHWISEDCDHSFTASKLKDARLSQNVIAVTDLSREEHWNRTAEIRANTNKQLYASNTYPYLSAFRGSWEPYL